MAVVDLESERIIGCKEGSFTWYHEKGHIEFNKKDKGIKVSYFKTFSFGLTIFFTVISLFVSWMKYFALLSLVLALYYYLYEEIWCWIYSLKEVKKLLLGKKPKKEQIPVEKFSTFVLFIGFVYLTLFKIKSERRDKKCL